MPDQVISKNDFNVMTVTPTVSASAIYAANDQVGGIMEFTGILGEGRVGQLVYVSLYDKALQSAVIQVFLFHTLPTIGSIDNGASTMTAAEGTKLMAAFSFVNAGYLQFGTPGFTNFPTISNAYFPQSIYTKNPGGTVWAVMKTTGTPTYASTSDLTLTLGVILGV